MVYFYYIVLVIVLLLLDGDFSMDRVIFVYKVCI